MKERWLAPLAGVYFRSFFHRDLFLFDTIGVDCALFPPFWLFLLVMVWNGRRRRPNNREFPFRRVPQTWQFGRTKRGMVPFCEGGPAIFSFALSMNYYSRSGGGGLGGRGGGGWGGFGGGVGGGLWGGGGGGGWGFWRSLVFGCLSAPLFSFFLLPDRGDTARNFRTLIARRLPTPVSPKLTPNFFLDRCFPGRAISPVVLQTLDILWKRLL